VKDGLCRVGLTQEELNDLAISGVEKRATKCSTRDLPFVIAKQRAFLKENKSKPSPSQWGATTVASTMHLAHMAGISTFVTGGTGGVHRGGESSMDISADLIELARTPVVVVSAGVKSILDIKRTLETLETNGVPTAAFGVDDFPAFFSPTSGIASPARVDSAEEVASAYLSSLELGLKNGMLIAVPNNDPAGASVEMAIQEVLDEANVLGITGRDVTPYILKKVAEKTKGDSLKSNTSLVKGNAAVGADIAVAIANARSKYNNGRENRKTSVFSGLSSTKSIVKETGSFQESNRTKVSSRVVVMGGAVIDLVAKPAKGTRLIPATSNPGSCHESDGGVARNIAEVLGRLGSQPIIFSAVGEDSRGLSLMERMANEYGISRDRQYIKIVSGSNTATYLAVLEEDGDLHTAIADMDVLTQIQVPDEEVSYAQGLLFVQLYS
jgi:pseudouridine-5'-phosphate glycosidase